MGPDVLASSTVSVTPADVVVVVVVVSYSALSTRSNRPHLLADSQCPCSYSNAARWHGSVSIFDVIVVRVSAVVRDSR